MLHIPVSQRWAVLAAGNGLAKIEKIRDRWFLRGVFFLPMGGKLKTAQPYCKNNNKGNSTGKVCSNLWVDHLRREGNFGLAARKVNMKVVHHSHRWIAIVPRVATLAGWRKWQSAGTI